MGIWVGFNPCLSSFGVRADRPCKRQWWNGLRCLWDKVSSTFPRKHDVQICFFPPLLATTLFRRSGGGSVPVRIIPISLPDGRVIERKVGDIDTFWALFGCPGSSIPNLGQWVGLKVDQITQNWDTMSDFWDLRPLRHLIKVIYKQRRKRQKKEFNIVI